MIDIPEGFRPHTRRSPVTDAWQPLWARESRDCIELGFIVGDCHCNGRGLLHGGVLAALADNAMGLSVGRMMQEAERPVQEGGSGIVTTSLSVDYVGMARPGDCIVIAPRVVHLGKSSANADALVEANGRVIARASAAFRILSDAIPPREAQS